MEKTDIDQLVAMEVERRFKEHPPLHAKDCFNPVTEDHYVGGLDPVEPQKDKARRALLARAWFAVHGPADAPPLPVGNWDQVKYKDPINHLVAQFCVSLRAHGWDFRHHPAFPVYASGLLASPYAADIVRLDAAIRRRYPPKELHYIDAGSIWRPEPPKPLWTPPEVTHELLRPTTS